ITALKFASLSKSKILMASSCCCWVDRLLREGQLMLATVAIHAPRNSRLTSGRISLITSSSTAEGRVETGLDDWGFSAFTGFLTCLCVEHEFRKTALAKSNISFECRMFIGQNK